MPPIAAMREGVSIVAASLSRRALITRFAIAAVAMLAVSKVVGGHLVPPVLLTVLAVGGLVLFSRVRRAGRPRRYRVIPALAEPSA